MDVHNLENIRPAGGAATAVVIVVAANTPAHERVASTPAHRGPLAHRSSEGVGGAHVHTEGPRLGLAFREQEHWCTVALTRTLFTLAES